MLLHFQIKSLFPNQYVAGWMFSFYFNQTKYEGIYQADGQINWTSSKPDSLYIDKVQKQIHDLMIYHIYDADR